jgi:hypothetical protein
MTPMDLYLKLRDIGYSLPKGLSRLKVEGERWPDDALRRALEIDRLAVFRLWYGTEMESNDAAGIIVQNFESKMIWASMAYASGEIEYCIDYILRENQAAGSPESSLKSA